MQIRVLDDAEAVGREAATIVCGAVRAKPAAALGLPTGATPLPMYRELGRRARDGSADFGEATGYAIDEFAGVPFYAPGTNAEFFRAHADMGLRALTVPDSGAPDPDAEVRALATAVEAGGGFDLCVLGIGANGHIAFNEPGSEVDTSARVVELTATSRRAHAAGFGGLARVPALGMTLGVADLVASRRLLVLATGAEKAAIVASAIEGPMRAEVPASWLQSHGLVLWLLDRPAAAAMRKTDA